MKHHIDLGLGLAQAPTQLVKDVISSTRLELIFLHQVVVDVLMFHTYIKQHTCSTKELLGASNVIE